LVGVLEGKGNNRAHDKQLNELLKRLRSHPETGKLVLKGGEEHVVAHFPWDKEENRLQ